MASNENTLNVSVLGAAKEMYIKQLKILLTPLIHEGLISLWEDAQRKEDENGGYNYLKQFQIYLKDIPNWNASILEEEARRILGKVDILMELVTAVFVSHVKILASVRLGGKNRNIKISVPSQEIFIHTIYTNAAEMIYYNPTVFQNHTDRDSYESIRDLINKSIDETINSMIPIESILKEYLSNVFSGHIKSQPLPVAEPTPTAQLLTSSDMGLLDENPSPSNDQFGTADDLFSNPFGDVSNDSGAVAGDTDMFGGDEFEKDATSVSDLFGGSDPFGGDDDLLKEDTTGDSGGDADLFGSSADPFSSLEDPLISGGDSSFGSSTDDADPFGSSVEASGSSADADPFGSSVETSGSSADADPFGGSADADAFGGSADADAFGSSADTDPFGTDTGGDPFGGSTDADPFGGSTEGDAFGSPTDADPFGAGGGDSDPFALPSGDSDPFGGDSFGRSSTPPELSDDLFKEKEDVKIFEQDLP